jgi:hypothetical protein
MWSDDGFIIRFPETEHPPPVELVIPDPDEVEQLVLRQLGASSLFAAKFREAAARALLLPRTRIQGRTPLWQQRKRAYDLLQVASRFGSFPIILEAYRETLRDVFDVPALVEMMKRIRQRTIRVHTADTAKPSPFAASVLFRFASGATGYLSTVAATGRMVRVQVFGSRGWLQFMDHQPVLERADLDGRVTRTEFPTPDIERLELEAFARAVAGTAPYPVPVEDAVHGIAVLQAIVQSAARDGERVLL